MQKTKTKQSTSFLKTATTNKDPPSHTHTQLCGGEMGIVYVI